MATINLLPKEILLNIFRRIGTAAQMGKCRLVCRKWNYPSEVIMLGCKIVLNSLDKAIQLYGHLCTDITKGRYIKHLHLKIEGRNLPLIYTHLLPLAFTPSMELLTGTVHARGFFTTLMQIAHSSTAEFNKLIKLPDGLNGHGETIVIKAMIHFNFNSLFFTIGTFRNGLNGNAINLLDKFRCLETLRLTGYIDDWKNLEYALKKCANLKTLAFDDVTINISISSKTSVDSWVRHNVRPESSLTVITIQSLYPHPNMLEYLVYKYPNVSIIKLNGRLYHTNFDPLVRILNAVDGVASKNLVFTLPGNINIKETVKFARSRHENIKFQIKKIDGQEELIMYIK